MMMVQIPVLIGFSSLTDRAVWSQTANHMHPDVILHCGRLHPQTLPGCITASLLGAHYPLICGSSCLIYARGMSNLTQDGVYSYGDRVYQSGCSRVPGVRSGECRASMDGTHLIFDDRKNMISSGSQTWQLKIIYNSNSNWGLKVLSIDRSSLHGRFSVPILIFDCQYIMYIRRSLSV